MNLMMLLEMAAQGFGDRVAVQNGDDTLSYSQLFRAAGAGAEVAKASGADHVAVLTDQSVRTSESAERSPDDEHRVFYVAATRARESLTVVIPQGIRGYKIVLPLVQK